MLGRRPTATALKLIRGETRAERLKDDTPKHASAPTLPPGVTLSAAELAMWHWLIEHVYSPGTHGTGDGAAFVKVARLWARVNEADAQIAQHGLVGKVGLHGREQIHAHTRLSRDLWQQLGAALAEIGGTPAGRVRIAAVRERAGGDDAWSDVD